MYTNTLLTISLRDYPGQDGLDDESPWEPMETDDDTSDLYDSEMAIPDTVFDTDTDVNLIPGDLMEKFLKRCQSGGVYLNPSKFNIALDGESLIFAGIQVGSEGYSMDPARLDAIREFR